MASPEWYKLVNLLHLPGQPAVEADLGPTVVEHLVASAVRASNTMLYLIDLLSFFLREPAPHAILIVIKRVRKTLVLDGAGGARLLRSPVW